MTTAPHVSLWASPGAYLLSCLPMSLSCLPIGGVLPRIVDMLADTMPAVSAAAANCLHKISGLYIGVQVSWYLDIVVTSAR